LLKTGFFRHVRELKIQKKNPGGALQKGKGLRDSIEGIRLVTSLHLGCVGPRCQELTTGVGRFLNFIKNLRFRFWYSSWKKMQVKFRFWFRFQL
jgi:hypothetical protein